jgi:hypothetical protein
MELASPNPPANTTIGSACRRFRNGCADPRPPWRSRCSRVVACMVTPIWLCGDGGASAMSDAPSMAEERIRRNLRDISVSGFGVVFVACAVACPKRRRASGTTPFRRPAPRSSIPFVPTCAPGESDQSRIESVETMRALFIWDLYEHQRRPPLCNQEQTKPLVGSWRGLDCPGSVRTERMIDEKCPGTIR